MNCRYLQMNWRYLQLNWRYLQIESICRYLQLICRYLQLNCRYLQFIWRYLQFIWRYLQFIWRYLQLSRFEDICNWIADMCTSIGDIFNSVNKCENGAPYYCCMFEIMTIHMHKLVKISGIVNRQPWNRLNSYAVHSVFWARRKQDGVQIMSWRYSVYPGTLGATIGNVGSLTTRGSAEGRVKCTEKSVS